MADKRKSILVDSLDYCYECGKPHPHKHEVFFGKNRDDSIKYNMILPLCYEHHEGIEDRICAGIQTLPIRNLHRMYLSIHTAQERILSVSLENPTYRVETPANAKETDLLTFLLHITNLLLIESKALPPAGISGRGKE